MSSFYSVFCDLLGRPYLNLQSPYSCPLWTIKLLSSAYHFLSFHFKTQMPQISLKAKDLSPFVVYFDRKPNSSYFLGWVSSSFILLSPFSTCFIEYLKFHASIGTPQTTIEFSYDWDIWLLSVSHLVKKIRPRLRRLSASEYTQYSAASPSLRNNLWISMF